MGIWDREMMLGLYLHCFTVFFCFPPPCSNIWNPPLGSPILFVLGFFFPLSRGGHGCCKKKVSWGVAKHRNTVLDGWCKGLLSADHFLLPLIINNTDFILLSQKTLKWKKSALQILTISKVTSRSTLNSDEEKKKKKQEAFNEDATYKYVYSCQMMHAQRFCVHVYLHKWVKKIKTPYGWEVL